MNLSNGLTLSRLVAIPLLMALLLVAFPGHDQVAAAVFILFSLTDTLDGQLARRRGMVTDLGKFLDPLADKLFVLSVLIVLVQEGLVAAWVVVVIFSRELIITILRSVGASQGRVIAAAPLGKTKTVMQMSAVTLLILQRPYSALVPVADFAVAVAMVFTIWSGLDYIWRFRYLLGPFDSSRMPGRTGPSGGAPQPGEDAAEASRELGETLRVAGLTLAVAESCTGGLVGALITDRPGSSAYFLGGVIAYSDVVKTEQLGVSAALLERAGAVSREVAEAMADGARLRFSASIAVSVTGVAGPEGGSAAKPVGLTYVGVASNRGTVAHEYRFGGDRWSNRREAATAALRLSIEEARAVERSRAKTA
ncbi:MAG TPA: CDP-diacylglycerol--glycerol-3-phosphate 3-phosphatidyltransferase [Candidatus Dormibacteraeota bacterium]|jgi:CDP-diacylglycerol--glycerol-3-phosphate 3-phosphatidyltransferase